MSRTLWFVAGAGAGIYGMVRGRRAAEVFTADGLRDRVEALTLGARLFRDEVAQGTVERETELRERFGVLPHGHQELEVSTGSTAVGSSSRDTKEGTP